MNIKRFTLLALSVSVLTVGAFVGFKNEKIAKYNPREVSLSDGFAKSFRGAHEYLMSIRENVKTGRVDYREVAEAKKQMEKNRLSSHKALQMNWEFKGPDNIGGRTRGFIIDRNDPQTLYAGSTSGGLFVSTNGGNTWESYNEELENFAISTIAQSIDGDVYYGTGPIFDAGVRSATGDIGDKHISSAFLGGGLFKLLGNGQVEKVIGPGMSNVPSEDWNMINKIATHPSDADVMYVAIDAGLKMTRDGGITWTPITGLPNQYPDDVEISSDGTVMVSYSSPGRIFRSIVDTSFQQIINIPFSVGTIRRVEYAIAPSNPQVHYASVAYFAGYTRLNCLYGVFQSIDNGSTWKRIIDPALDNFDFFNNGEQCQGKYDNALSVYPNNPYKILIGGITLYRWEQTAFPPQQPNGTLNELGSTLNFPGNQYYLHADKHNITFLNDSVLYVTSDGGVARSESINESDPLNITFDEINFGYQVTQYYGMGFGPTGLLIGGSQDNGTSIVGFNFNAGKSGFEVISGDGFDADLSNLNPTIGFGASQYGRIRKVTGIGNTLGSSNIDLAPLFNGDPDLSGVCGPSGCGPFYTNLRLWESFYDESSKDSVTFDLVVEKGDVITTGTKVTYNSFTNKIPLKYTTTQDYHGPKRAGVADTVYKITTIDYVQAVLAAGNLKGPQHPTTGQVTTLHITRDAVNGDLPVDWIQVAGPSSQNLSSDAIYGSIIATEFSNDGNHIFLGTRNVGGGGSVYRVSGIKNVYTDADGTLAGNQRKAVTRKIGEFFNAAVTGIAIDPNNANNVIITLGNYGHTTHVLRTTNGTTASGTVGTFTNISGSGATALINAPAYDALIEMHDSNVVLVGTDFGIYATDNAFDANPANVQWSHENEGMPNVPIYEIRQQTFGIDDSSRGITNTGEIFVVSHARGFYRSVDLVGINENKPKKDVAEQIFSSSLKVYPNPAVNYTNISFDLASSNVINAKIYDIKGKLIRDANYGKLPAGPHNIQVNAQNLPVGTYIIQLNADGMSATAKFIVQK